MPHKYENQHYESAYLKYVHDHTTFSVPDFPSLSQKQISLGKQIQASIPPEFSAFKNNKTLTELVKNPPQGTDYQSVLNKLQTVLGTFQTFLNANSSANIPNLSTYASRLEQIINSQQLPEHFFFDNNNQLQAFSQGMELPIRPKSRRAAHIYDSQSKDYEKQLKKMWDSYVKPYGSNAIGNLFEYCLLQNLPQILQKSTQPVSYVSGATSDYIRTSQRAAKNRSLQWEAKWVDEKGKSHNKRIYRSGGGSTPLVDLVVNDNGISLKLTLKETLSQKMDKKKQEKKYALKIGDFSIANILSAAVGNASGDEAKLLYWGLLRAMNSSQFLDSKQGQERGLSKSRNGLLTRYRVNGDQSRFDPLRSAFLYHLFHQTAFGKYNDAADAMMVNGTLYTIAEIYERLEGMSLSFSLRKGGGFIANDAKRKYELNAARRFFAGKEKDLPPGGYNSNGKLVPRMTAMLKSRMTFYLYLRAKIDDNTLIFS